MKQVSENGFLFFVYFLRNFSKHLQHALTFKISTYLSLAMSQSQHDCLGQVFQGFDDSRIDS